MTPTAQRYAQIEACERFQDYLVGLQFHAETDHKPLVPLFGRKLLDELPLKVQRFRMRLMRFNFTISHVPGKYLSTADALSRAPISNTIPPVMSLRVRMWMLTFQMAVQSLPATESRLESVRSHQESDSVCKQVVSYCLNGWPRSPRSKTSVKPFYSVVGELTIQGGLLMNERESFGHSYRDASRSTDTITCKSPRHLKEPTASKAIGVVARHVCRRLSGAVLSVPRATLLDQSLLSTPLPTLPWQRVGTDLFEWKGATSSLSTTYLDGLRLPSLNQQPRAV